MAPSPPYPPPESGTNDIDWLNAQLAQLAEAVASSVLLSDDDLEEDDDNTADADNDTDASKDLGEAQGSIQLATPPSTPARSRGLPTPPLSPSPSPAQSARQRLRAWAMMKERGRLPSSGLRYEIRLDGADDGKDEQGQRENAGASLGERVREGENGDGGEAEKGGAEGDGRVNVGTDADVGVDADRSGETEALREGLQQQVNDDGVADSAEREGDSMEKKGDSPEREGDSVEREGDSVERGGRSGEALDGGRTMTLPTRPRGRWQQGHGEQKRRRVE